MCNILTRNSKMAEFNNSNAGPGYNPWMVMYHYGAQSSNIYEFETDFNDPAYALPCFSNFGKYLSWKVVRATME
jgi:hypothetical protein